MSGGVKISQMDIFLCLVVITCCYATGETSLKHKSYLNGFHPIGEPVSALQEKWSQGDADAGADLIFAKALGARGPQDLHDVISSSILSLGAARAHTTVALLLNHNLTDIDLTKEERENKATINYNTAAVKGDPIAQIVTGENYLKRGDCEAALAHYHKAASFAINDVFEMEILNSGFVRHVWDEDGEVSGEDFPTQEELNFFEHLIYHGDVDAALKAASFYISGPGEIERDLEKGHEYLKLAVKGNNTLAMVYLAQMYIRNMMDGDDYEALELLERALKYENTLAHSGIGKLYMEGRAGLQKDLAKAEHHLKKGIEAGNVDAIYQLGKLYSLNEGLGSYDEAAELWKIPTSIGHVHSAWQLAEYYRNTLLKTFRTATPSRSTSISTKLCENAVVAYRTVAQSGQWNRLLSDAFIDYSNGRNTAALMKYLLLSDLGYRAAHINAARILDEGGHGLYEDETSSAERAFEMWRRTTWSGKAKGYTRMGDYLYYGIGGMRKDLRMAARHYKKASALGDAEGGFSLALVTEWGEGTEQDLTKAQEILSNLANISPEAEVPAALVLMRVKIFSFVRDMFNIDLYTWNWDVNSFTSAIYSKSNLLLQWDIWVMSVLAVFISINIYRRYQ